MLDFATVLFINLVIGIMGSATFLILWIQNRKHLQGIGWGLIFSLIIILYLTLLVLGEIFPNSLSVLKPPSASLLTALTLLLIIQPLGLILYVQNRLSLKIKKELQYKTKLEEELKEANIKAEISVKTKEAFLANMSHEIRTPMNSILGFIDIALEGRGIPPRERNLILTAQTSAKGLLSIINDFLDISNLDASKLQIAQKPFMIIPLLEKVMDTMRLILAEKPLDIALDISDDLDLCIDSDPDRMRQILVSIIGNSIKFTERGKIIVSVQDRKDGMLLFTIADTGQGMTQDQTEHLFDLFYQADSSTSRTYGGNGLGTTISKELIKLMGGDIWVESILGKGSTFYFTLPLIKSEFPTVREETIMGDQIKNPAKEIRGPVTKKTYDILMAEDIMTNATIAKYKLNHQGHKVTIVKNGKEAVDEFKSNSYDIILMDIHMPIMDGREATKQIRKLTDRGGEKIPIVALTASVMQEDRDLCAQAGMNRVVAKPVQFSELFAVMDELMMKSTNPVQS